MRENYMINDIPVDVSSRELVFFTHIDYQGRPNTILWKYRVESRELIKCFTLDEKIMIWKYPDNKKEEGIKFIGVYRSGKSMIMGLNENGTILFRHVVRGMAGKPCYDSEGNIFISVDSSYMVCLNTKGDRQKWIPVCDRFVPFNLSKYWVDNDRLIAICGEHVFVLGLDGTVEEKYPVSDYPQNVQEKSKEEGIVRYDGKHIVIYDEQGHIRKEYSRKEYIIWANVFGEKLILLVETAGNIAIVEKDLNEREAEVVIKLPSNKETENCFADEELLSWQGTLCEYILLNLKLSMKYRDVKMKEVALFYEPFRTIQIKVRTGESDWVDGCASSIPYEAWCDNEDDRESFKECECRDEIIWSEFCDYCPNEDIRPIMEKVREELEIILGVSVKLEEGFV